MSLHFKNLCCCILKEHFGQVVSSIASVLLTKGPCPLNFLIGELHKTVNIKLVKRVLCLLIQQNLVTFDINSKKQIQYSIHGEAIIWRMQYPKYIYAAKCVFGDAAELIVEHVLHKGQVLMSALVKAIADKLNEALEAAGHKKITESFVQEKFELLVQCHFLIRCPDVLLDNDCVVGLDIPADQYDLFTIPEAGSRKRRHVSTENEGPATKRKKKETEGPDDEGVYWKVNFERFHQYLRDQVLIEAASSKIDKKASEVLRAMLRLNEVKSEPRAFVSSNMSLTEIQNALPKDMMMTRNMVDMYLSLMMDDLKGIVNKVDGSSGGMYAIDFVKGMREMAISHIESVVQERFGSKSLRIFRLLLMKRHLEQKQIEDWAMISAKEAKELLYKMFGENFVAQTELSKTADHAPSRTFYLFHVDIPCVARIVQEKCYKSINNSMIKREEEVKENKRLLEKKERVEAIVASLSEDAQKEEIMQTITPPEQEQIQRIKKVMSMLDSSELQIDETLMVMKLFLSYIEQPPVIKKKKNAT